MSSFLQKPSVQAVLGHISPSLTPNGFHIANNSSSSYFSPPSAPSRPASTSQASRPPPPSSGGFPVMRPSHECFLQPSADKSTIYIYDQATQQGLFEVRHHGSGPSDPQRKTVIHAGVNGPELARIEGESFKTPNQPTTGFAPRAAYENRVMFQMLPDDGSSSLSRQPLWYSWYGTDVQDGWDELRVLPSLEMVAKGQAACDEKRGKFIVHNPALAPALPYVALSYIQLLYIQEHDIQPSAYFQNFPPLPPPSGAEYANALNMFIHIVDDENTLAYDAGTGKGLYRLYSTDDPNDDPSKILEARSDVIDARTGKTLATIDNQKLAIPGHETVEIRKHTRHGDKVMFKAPSGDGSMNEYGWKDASSPDGTDDLLLYPSKRVVAKGNFTIGETTGFLHITDPAHAPAAPYALISYTELLCHQYLHWYKESKKTRTDWAKVNRNLKGANELLEGINKLAEAMNQQNLNQ